MELFLLKDELKYLKPVLKKTYTKEESIEIIVSDSMPDVDCILSVAAVPMMREKEAFLGKMVVSGVSDVAIFYESSEADETKKIATTMEFSSSFDSSDITTDSLLVAKVKVTNADARIINSRKVAIKLELQYDVEAYNKMNVEIPYGVNGSESVELLTCKKEILTPMAVSEKVFSITDSVKTPSMADVTVGDLDICVDEAKIVDTKAVIKGTATTTLLVGDDEKKVESPFSQVVDLETDNEPQRILCTLMATGIYSSERTNAESGENETDIEINIVCQCVSGGEETINYISDAYSTCGTLDINKSELCLYDMNSADDETSEVMISYISAISESEADGSACRPSLICCRVQNGDTLWQIAKKYCAAKNSIIAANGLDSEEIESGLMILIPKK